MNSDFYLLFYPIFWDKDKILRFLVEYYELLHQGRGSKPIKKIIKSLNNKKNSILETPCNPLRNKDNETVHEDQCGWLHNVWELEKYRNGQVKLMSFIGAYLKYTEHSYNGHCWFDMMRAIRNLYVHKYDTQVKGYTSLSVDEQREVNQMQSRIRELIAENYLDYWIGKFPDLLFVIYHHATENFKTYIKLPGTQDECNLRKNFVEKYYIEENAHVSSIPVRLEDVVSTFGKFSTTEANNTSGLLLHSVKIIGGPDVHFMKYPTSIFSGGIYSPNEIVTMTLSLDYTTDCPNLTCKIDRKLNTLGENTILPGFNLKRFKQEVLKAKSTLTFKQTSVKNFPADIVNKLYIFTDDILCALLYHKMFHEKRNFQSIFIYTNKAFREVSHITKNIYPQLNQRIDIIGLSWKNLNTDYKRKLFEKTFLVQPKSMTTSELKMIYPKLDDCRVSENKLVELMHDSAPTLLSTGIPPFFNERQFYTRSLAPILSTDNQLIHDKKLKHNLIHECITKTVTLIHGSTCMGKSWLLASIGCHLETHNQLVNFKNAADLVLKLKTNGDRDYQKAAIIEILWESNLEQDYITRKSDKRKLIYLLIDDFGEIVDETQNELLFCFLNNVREKLNVKLVITSSKHVNATRNFENSEIFSLQPIDINAFIKQYFNDIAITQPNGHNSFVTDLETEYKTQCINLGDFKETPFVCSVWCSAYEKQNDLANPIRPNNRLTLTQIHSDLVERKLKNHYPNYEHYVNTNVLLWPHLIKSFMRRFCEFKPDLLKTGYVTDLFGDKITSKALHTDDFLQGSIIDYFISYLIEKIVFLTNAGSLKANMCAQLWKVLQVDKDKKKFEYENIVEFLDSMCSAEMIKQVVDASVDVNKTVHDILKYALKFKYEQLFVSILTIVDTYDRDVKLKGLYIEDKIYATKIFRHACDNENYLVLDYLIRFNCLKWDHQPSNDSTCLSYVERHITDANKKQELIREINKWNKSINPQ